jgi:hypothetical protein
MHTGVFRGLLEPVILPNVAGVEMLAGGAFSIAWFSRLNASTRKLALHRSRIGKRFSNPAFIS